MPTKCIPPNAFSVLRQICFLASLLFIAVSSVLPVSASAATVTTDQPDYPPGDSVVITGSGFWGSEIVTVQVTHYDGTPTTGLGHSPWDVIADALGEFETYWLIPEDDNLDETLMVTAYGQSSGLYAYTLFADHNTKLTLLTAIPDTLCPSSTIQVCVQLTQACGGGVFNPLPNRPIYFFVNPGNCGVDVGQNADDTVLTDTNGVACATLTIPIGTGTHAIRAKFLGEDKPGPADPPNGVCQTNQRVQLSAANECETFKVHPNACNQPPVATCPGDSTIFLCSLQQVCITGFNCSDPDGNLSSCNVSLGTLSGNQVCFTPTGEGNYTIRLIATDSQGLADTCETVVTIVLNDAPVANCPGDQALFVCDLSQICISGFTYSDPNNNIASVNVTGGTLSGNQVCFTPVEGVNTITMIVTDSCGKADTCATNVTVSLNEPPVAVCPGNQTLFVCDLSQICISGFTYSDPNNNIASVNVTGGTLSGNQVCFTPVEGVNTITMIVTDSCGAADTCVTVLTVNLNSPPVVSCPANVALDLFALSEVCLPGFTASDPDGNLANVVVTGGSLSNDTVCFNPVEGLNIITISAIDACGATAVCTTEVYINLISTCPVVKIEKTHNTLQGHYQDVAITIEDAGYDMGGFDFLIAYDASALTFIQATAGEVLTGCAWEYFTYRFGPFGNCGAGCPSGMIRIVALAETNNGPVSPDCFGPADGSPHTLAILRFLVSNDRTLECQYVPIRFFWLDCGDNAIASVTGDTTFLDSKIFEFSGGLLWDEIDNVSFPEGDRIANIGAPDYPCMVGEKRVPIRCIEFWNGGIDIICADSIDARGDVNLNSIPNEIGDAVTFINYFIAGLAAFTVSIEGQIAATELNGDGVVLSVADLVYLIRVVIGDAQPLAKMTPFAESVTVRYNGSTVSADAELGAAFLVFAGDVPVTLGSGAYGMDIKTGLVDGNTHVLIYSLDRGRIFSGEILHASGALLNFDGSDYYGNAYRVVMNPGRFAVSNFPNPFNAQTVIHLELPSATDYEVTIYNISGQKVHGWSGYSEAGILELNWTADVASGIYFYKVQAGAYGVTKKMVLLK